MIKSGDLLISYPYLEDDYFFRSVICMIEHNNEGSFGLIINKKMPYKIGEVLPMLSNLKNDIYMGGPVDTQALFFLHPYKDLKDSLLVQEGVYMNGDINELSDMLELEFAKEEELRFFLGYSGWSVGQLKDELKEKSWLIGDFNKDFIFHKHDDDTLWKKAVTALGEDYEKIAHYPVDPQMN